MNNFTTLNPQIAIAAQKSGQSQNHRLWLFLRSIDSDGAGMLDEGFVRSSIEDSKLFSWRRGRQILNSAGHYFTWCKKKKQIYLVGMRAVAHYYGQRVGIRSVKMAIQDLTGKLKDYRSFIWAAWHGSRKESKPICRSTLSQVSGLSMNTQRSYELDRGVEIKSNFAVGPRNSGYAREQVARRTMFVYRSNGAVGREGDEFIAWRLPNSYSVDLAIVGYGRRKKVNKNLVNKEKQGEKIYFLAKDTKGWARVPRSRMTEVSLQDHKNDRMWYGSQ